MNINIFLFQPMNRMDQLFEEMVDFDKSEEIMETNVCMFSFVKIFHFVSLF